MYIYRVHKSSVDQHPGSPVWKQDLHRESKKQDTKLLFISSPNIDRFFKILLPLLYYSLLLSYGQEFGVLLLDSRCIYDTAGDPATWWRKSCVQHTGCINHERQCLTWRSEPWRRLWQTTFADDDDDDDDGGGGDDWSWSRRRDKTDTTLPAESREQRAWAAICRVLYTALDAQLYIVYYILYIMGHKNVPHFILDHNSHVSWWIFSFIR